MAAESQTGLLSAPANIQFTTDSCHALHGQLCIAADPSSMQESWKCFFEHLSQHQWSSSACTALSKVANPVK